MTKEEYEEKSQKLLKEQIKQRKRYDKFTTGAAVIFATALPAMLASFGLLVGGGVTYQLALEDAANSQEYILETTENITKSIETYDLDGDFDAFKDKVNYYRSKDSVIDYILKNDSLETYAMYKTGKGSFLSGIGTTLYTITAIVGSCVFSDRMSQKYQERLDDLGIKRMRLNENYNATNKDEENE